MFSYQKEETPKHHDVVDKQSTLFFWDEKYASFAQLMSFDSCNTYLRNFAALIYCTFLPYKQILPVKPFFLSLTF